jgi:DNA-binding PadR family transcriptional regulator
VGRVFKKGELPMALLVVIGTLGEAHGYAIMLALRDRVGGDWRPSPGAIYPALLTLQDVGLVEADDRDGSRVYRLTERGREAAGQMSLNASWELLSERAKTRPAPVTLARLVREFQAGLPEHRSSLSQDQAVRIEELLTRAAVQVKEILSQHDGGDGGVSDGLTNG